MSAAGPLAGLKVVELAGLAPAPFACMLLADLGADVLTIERATAGPGGATVPPAPGTTRVLNRGRTSIGLDLKLPGACAVVLDLSRRADVLVEGFRPGVMERLGLGPDECLAANPGLVYGRVTGWGQDGPLAHAAGHDINYIALSGALHMNGPAARPPMPPINLLGDFAGGGLMLAYGVLAALFERQRSGAGQVVDAAMLDGAAVLTTFIHGIHQAGAWTDERESNLLDGGTPYYGTYETKDGRYVSIGQVEPHFYAELLSRLGLHLDPARQNDAQVWPQQRAQLEQVFRTRTQADWCALLEGTDACFAPVLSLADVAAHPHNRARQLFVEIGGITQPAPAPRFTRTPPAVPTAPPAAGSGGRVALRDWGVGTELLEAAIAEGAIHLPAG